MLKEEQARITRELAKAGALLANTEIQWETIEANLDLALQLAGNPQKAFQESDHVGRRALNQAIFEAIYVDIDGVSYTLLKDPFTQLLAEDFLDELDAVIQRPGRGSNTSYLVEVAGVEPASPKFSVGILRAQLLGSVTRRQVNSTLPASQPREVSLSAPRRDAAVSRPG